jgi:hypothetical protein
MAVPSQRKEMPDLVELGRIKQRLAFLKGLQGLSSSGAKRARAFFLYGPRGFGHRQLAERLVRVVEENAFVQPRCYTVRAGTLWRDGSRAGLLRALAREIHPEREPGEVAELADELLNPIRGQDVILQISGLEDYAGGAEAFCVEFWNPLVEVLPDSLPHRLICLAAVETKAKKLHIPSAGGKSSGKQHHQARAAVLPRLGKFTEEELCLWLSSRLPAPDAESLTSYLMDKTEGVPGTLYEFLAGNKALWASEEI